MNRHILSVRQHSCIMLRHFYYVGRHVSVHYATLLLVLRHLCCVGRHVSVQCDDIPALCYDTSVMRADTSLFSTVLVSISFIVTGLYMKTFI